MRTTTMLAGLAGAALLINCGGDYCSNMETFENNAAQRNGACNGGFTLTQTFSQSSCESALNNQCTNSDQSALAKASSCLNGLPQCTPGTQTTFDGDVTACNGNAQGVTLSCTAALVEAGVPVLFSSGQTCSQSGATCSKNSDCCSGNCASGNTCG